MSIKFWQRRVRPREDGDDSSDRSAIVAIEGRRPDAGHALRAPSPLHAFNRYEIKYLVDQRQVGELRQDLAQRLDLDPYGVSGGYGVWSVYYDTQRLRFYWEKIEGLRFRRKLRIRHYGDRFTIDDEAPVFVEIKQRVNRVTQKRRVRLAYRSARQLCAGADPTTTAGTDPRGAADVASGTTGDAVHDMAGRADHAFLAEVRRLVTGLDLRPTIITGYQREAFIGRDADVGLRVTLDSRVRGRDRDFDLAADVENRLLIPARFSVLEVKVNERVPAWLTDLTARQNLSVVRLSKYCQGVEAFGRAPRSVFHLDDQHPEAGLSGLATVQTEV